MQSITYAGGSLPTTGSGSELTGVSEVSVAKKKKTIKTKNEYEVRTSALFKPKIQSILSSKLQFF